MSSDRTTLPVTNAVQTLEADGVEAAGVLRFGEPAIRVEFEGMSLLVSVLGAQILEWTPHECNQLLWPGSENLHRPGTPIRGGIPLCWPWFGAAHRPFDGSSHGHGRRRHWNLVSTSRRGSDITLHWQLSIFSENYRLVADYHITAGRSLELRLVTTNLHDQPCAATPAFHPYFAINELTCARLKFAGAVQPRDRLTGQVQVATERLAFNDEELELEWNAWRDIELISGNSRLWLQSSDATHCVVWNPGPIKAATLSDLAPGAHHNFICVEPGRLEQSNEKIEPGATSTLSMRLSNR